jgi:vacuolar protein sorting-associated protein 13A/C
VGDCELPVLEMGALGLGTEAEFRTFDLKGSAFLKELWLKCPEYLGKTIKICTLFS